ncbi:MAG: phosphorylase family protein [Dehalococcoidia bacterium]
MVPVHIQASAGDVAKVVLLPGDPGRAGRVAAMLESVRCYNENRGLLGFTGASAGQRISVQTTGMGAPSAAIVAEELAMLGAQVLIRIGTAGGASARIRAGDLVIATGSVPLDGTTRAYLSGDPYAPVADFGVVQALTAACAGEQAPYHTGLIATGDALYAEDETSGGRWAARGVLAFEMEASALFTVAALRGVRAGCLVLVTNAAGVHDRLEGAAYETAERTMLRAGIAAACALAGSCL